jgi:dihydrodipicolinate synthase/N-acetylneuraminate lyase
MSSSSKKFRGIVVPMSTPFTAAGQLDEAAAVRMVARLAEHQLGVFVLGTTGEAPSIPLAQRERLVELAVQAAGGRVPVFGGIGSDCVADSITMARAYLRLGADAVVSLLPGYYVLNPAEMQACFERIGGETPGSVLIYNMPQTTRMSIPLDVIDRLSSRENIVGLKDSEGTPGRLEAIAERFAGRPNFSTFMGVAKNTVQALRAGFDGGVPSSGNIAPALWRDLYAQVLSGDWPQAEALQARLNDIGDIVQRGRSLPQSLAALKAAVAAQGLCTPAVLAPLVACATVERDTIRQELIGLGLA